MSSLITMGKLPWKIKNELNLLLSSMFLILAVMAQFCGSLSLVLEVKSNHIKDSKSLFLEMTEVITPMIVRSVPKYCQLYPICFIKI